MSKPPKTQVPVVALVGATATGKTDLAVRLAEQVDGEIINADSMQFYTGLRIGVGKITPEEMRGVPHHLLDTLDLAEEASVAQFQTQARDLIATLRSAGKVPILTGGSGLYIRAALDDLEFPPTDAEVRQRLTREAQGKSLEELRSQLREVDPESAQKMQDVRRMIRALEVYELTGRTFTSFMPQRRYAPEVEPVIQIGLHIDKESLNRRIEHRVHTMIEAGWLDEIRELINQGLANAPTASKALGYEQMMEVLQGRQTLEAATERTIINTRKFAKRQLTWFKADPRVHWIVATQPDHHVLAETLTVLNTHAQGVNTHD